MNPGAERKLKLMNSDRLRTAFGAEVDVLIAASPENFFYTVGSMIVTHLPIRDRLAFGVVWPDMNVTAVVCSIEESLTAQESWTSDIRSYVEFRDIPTSLLAEVLRERGVQRGRLAVEKGYLREAYFEELRAALPDATWIDATPIFEHARMVKTPEHLDCVTISARKTAEALELAVNSLHAGLSEQAVMARVVGSLAEAGADGSMVVAAADSTALYHRATPAPVGPQQLLRLDVRANFGGIGSDMARTVVLGRPSSAQEQAYAALQSIRDAGLAAIAPGRPASSVALACARAAQEAGFSLYRDDVGHGFGLGTRERPCLHRSDGTLLDTGMVLCLEPMIAAAGGLLHVEDMIVVTQDGSEVLTDACSRNLIR